MSTNRRAGRPDPDAATIVTTIRLSENQRKKLRTIAKSEERSVTYLVRQAVSEFIEKEAA